jgi:phosphoribosyl 1,2-cyclic phosphodiesterase
VDDWILTLRGVRGSAPSPGAHTVRYGGHTTCLELAFAEDHRLILDCGSGLRTLGNELAVREHQGPLRFDVLLTHYHTDHLEGLRFFKPLYEPRSEFVFHGFPPEDMDVQGAVDGLMRPPWFPLRLEDTPSRKRFVDLSEGTMDLHGLSITAASVDHPQGSAGYRLDHGSHSIAFVTDTEPRDPASESAVARLAVGVGVLIHDAQYTPEEYERLYRGWGHSTWRHAIEAARRSGARELLLFHHDPDRSDEDLDAILEQARKEFPAVRMAREGMTLEL